MIPRITWAIFPVGANEGACAAARVTGCPVERGPGSVIPFSAASSTVSSARPTGNLPTARMYATRSAASCRVVVPGSLLGIVFSILLTSSDSGWLPQTPMNSVPVSGGPSSPCSISP